MTSEKIHHVHKKSSTLKMETVPQNLKTYHNKYLLWQIADYFAGTVLINYLKYCLLTLITIDEARLGFGSDLARPGKLLV